MYCCILLCAFQLSSFNVIRILDWQRIEEPAAQAWTVVNLNARDASELASALPPGPRSVHRSSLRQHKGTTHSSEIKLE